MKWYEKFKVGQEVRVVKKILSWRFESSTGGIVGRGASWVYEMNKTIDRVFEIVEIDEEIGYRLDTTKELGFPYWYPVESLQEPLLVGEQLLFNFMKE